MNQKIIGYDNTFNSPAINPLWLMVLLGVFTSQNFLITNPIFANESSIIQNSYIGSIIQRDAPSTRIKVFDLELEKSKWKTSINERYKTSNVTNVTEGVAHIRLVKYINSKPIKINVVEVNKKLNPNLILSPKLAYETQDSVNLKRKATIRTIAKNNNSIVAVNGTYFKPETGVPLGTLMIDRKLYTGPIYNRVAMGISDSGYKIARVELNAAVKSKNTEIKVDNVNQPRMLSTHTLVYTRDWGEYSPVSPKYGINFLVEEGKVTKISANPILIPKNGYVISGPKEQIHKFKAGEELELDIKTNPNWDDVNHIISGGPYLVKGGNTYVDYKEQKLAAVNGKNPRTAIGYTKDNNLVMVTVDGREQNSVGMTLFELAKFMKDIGCVEAMNLDGGGSSVMYVNGNIVNAPAQKGGIAISNALTISENITEDTTISLK